MSVMIEIEQKYRVLDEHLLPDFLKPFSYRSSVRVIDQYLDTLDGKYYKQGIFIRQRNNKSLDIKFNPKHLKRAAGKDHISCHEYNFELPFHPSSENLFESLSTLISLKKPTPYSFMNFLLENHLTSLITIDKARTSYETESCIIAVDELPGFGKFLELEAKDSKQDIQEFVHYAENLTKGIRLAPLSSGYVELALRQTNESLYLKGKYLLDDLSKGDAHFNE